MSHVFFGLTTAGILVLCAFGLLPPDQFVDVAKWVTILYALSTTIVAVVRHIWQRPPRDEVPMSMTDAPTMPWPGQPQEGVEALGPFGSLAGDVFSDQLGDNLPANYTSMVRDHDAPPVTTEGADGSTVTVPVRGAFLPSTSMESEVVPPLDFDGVFGPKPPIPHDYNRRSAPSQGEPAKGDAARPSDDQPKPTS
jgi:hypothetical protein